MPDNSLFDRNTILKILLGSILGVLAVWLAFRGVEVEQLLQVLRRANPWLVILGLGIVFLNVAVFSLRWWVTLIRDWQSKEYLTLLGGVYLGQMFNIVLPARLGELARIYFVSERLEITKSRLLGSLVLEKAVDIITFGLAVFTLITAMSLPAWVNDPGRSLLWLAAAAALGIIILALWGRRFLHWITPILRKLPGRWGERLAGILERALTGFDSLRSWKRQALIWWLSILSVVLSTLTNFTVLKALQIQAPFTAALFVLIVLQVGSAPPSAPGKLGVFHYLAVLVLSAFGVGKGTALAYGVLLYLVALVPKVIIGVGVMVFSRWGIADLKLNIED